MSVEKTFSEDSELFLSFRGQRCYLIKSESLSHEQLYGRDEMDIIFQHFQSKLWLPTKKYQLLATKKQKGISGNSCLIEHVG